MDRIKSCIFDIDGVLNHYPQSYVDYVNYCLNTNFKNLNEVKETLTFKEYKDVKTRYRESGIKAELKPREFAQTVLQLLKENDFYIILLSSRPVDDVPMLIPQTTEWLKKNHLFYDYLIFGHRKHLEVIKKFKTTKFVVEDNLEFSNCIGQYNNKVYLLNNMYNYGRGINKNVIRINNLTEIEEIRRKM